MGLRIWYATVILTGFLAALWVDRLIDFDAIASAGAMPLLDALTALLSFGGAIAGLGAVVIIAGWKGVDRWYVWWGMRIMYAALYTLPPAALVMAYGAAIRTHWSAWVLGALIAAIVVSTAHTSTTIMREQMTEPRG